MSFDQLNHEELTSINGELDQALHNHILWHNYLIRSLVCRLKGDRHDIDPEPHKECLFGQWYYEYSPKNLLDHPGYIAIEEYHRKMHQLASHLLQVSNSGATIDPYDYDNFANSMEKLRLEIESLKREIENLLYIRDPLTGAINRIDMIPMLRELYELIKRQPQECCISIFDFDQFKAINDQYGHPAGDKTLSTIVRFVSSQLRPYDKIFRFGGEEFLISLQNTSLSNAFQRIDSIREKISSLTIDIGRRDPIQVTVSFGIARLEPKFSINDSIQHADEALYKAKAEGRNCTKVWP